MKKLIFTTVVLLGLAGPVQALNVFDAANYAQNLLSAVRSLQIINNQVSSLANEVVMLQNMSRDLAQLGYSALTPIEQAMSEINALMARARGIAFQIAATEAEFARLFPQRYHAAITTDALLIDARARWEQQMEALRHAMLVQAQISSRIAVDTGVLTQLITQSQAATGNLQVQQAGNQLVGFLGQQQLQTQQLLAAQFRAQTLGEARAAMSEEQARAQLQIFLGDGVAYTAR